MDEYMRGMFVAGLLLGFGVTSIAFSILAWSGVIC